MAEQQDEISLRELVLHLWAEKWLVLSITLVLTVLAGVIASQLPAQYEAITVISPVSSNAAGGRLNSQGGAGIGGLASLIGIQLGGDTNRSESIAVLQSEALTERYIREHDLLPVLYEKLWDPVGKRWRVTDPSRVPTPWKANKLFLKIRTVTEDKKTGLVTLTINWTDAATAARWANDFVKLTNDYLREKAIAESEQHIAYLNQEAAKTDVAQVRTAIYTVLESEIKNVMLARGPGDYALKVIDPAIAPERKSSPKLSIWLPGGFGAGLLLSGIFLFVRSAWRGSPPAK